jgi:hypothetical protein
MYETGKIIKGGWIWEDVSSLAEAAESLSELRRTPLPSQREKCGNRTVDLGCISGMGQNFRGE